MDQGHDDNDEAQQQIYNQRGYEFPGRPIVTILNILQAPVAGALSSSFFITNMNNIKINLFSHIS